MATSSPSSRKNKRPVAHYIPSTHWDREWYQSFQDYRFRLVDVIDGLIELMESDPEYRYFQIDGQTCVLEDYLQIRPEQRERLQALFDAKRIQAGPWYVMPDEFLISGESLVRNLMRGHQIANEFSKPMKVGFVCDIFGHNSQFPQILQGFGIDNAVLWRATDFPGANQTGLFKWKAADGTEVLVYNHVLHGYGRYWGKVRRTCRQPDLSLDVEKAVEGIESVFEEEASRTPGDTITLFDGMDHMPVEPMTSELLARAREKGYDIKHSTFETFFKAVKKQNPKMPKWQGELRFAGLEWRDLIPGVLSSRNYLKQQNAHCENLLCHWAEPTSALAALLGVECADGYLPLAWKYLLLNHPHDSICGCSIDQVHRDMEYRYAQSRMIAERVTANNLRMIADQTPLPKLDGEEDYAVTVFNPTGEPIDGVVELPMYFNMDTENRFSEWFPFEPFVGFRLFDHKNKEIKYQRLDVTKHVTLNTYDKFTGFKNAKKERVNVATTLKIPPFGWTTLTCKPTKDMTRPPMGTMLVDDHTMENEFLRVAVAPNGTVALTDKKTKHTYENLLTFEDRADIGDGWNHGVSANDEIFTSHASNAQVALVHDGFALATLRVRVVMEVPVNFLHDSNAQRKRSDTLVPLVINNYLTLRTGSRHLEVRTEVDNTVEDHRLRVLFPTNLNVNTYFADSPYDVVERDITLRKDNPTLFEQEVETKPQYSFTAVNDSKHGLAVISTGQPESTVRDLPTRPIALTLFRGIDKTVGENVGHDGNDAQCLGTTTHQYWIYPHANALPTADLLRMGNRIATGVECVYTDQSRYPMLKNEPKLPATAGWLSSSAGPLVITACKRSEDGKAIVVRVFNPTTRAAKQTFTFITKIKSAHQTDLLEKTAAKLEADDNSVTISAKAKQIVTFRVKLAAIQ